MVERNPDNHGVVIPGRVERMSENEEIKNDSSDSMHSNLSGEEDEEPDELPAPNQRYLIDRKFSNPLVVQMPDGSVQVATQSISPNMREILCWNCHNQEPNFVVSCLKCSSKLIVPEGATHICCSICKNIFRISKNYYLPKGMQVNIFDYWDNH